MPVQNRGNRAIPSQGRRSWTPEEEYVIIIQGVPKHCKWQELKDLGKQTAKFVRDARVDSYTGVGHFVVRPQEAALRTYHSLVKNGFNGFPILVTLCTKNEPTKPIKGPTQSFQFLYTSSHPSPAWGLAPPMMQPYVGGTYRYPTMQFGSSNWHGKPAGMNSALGPWSGFATGYNLEGFEGCQTSYDMANIAGYYGYSNTPNNPRYYSHASSTISNSDTKHTHLNSVKKHWGIHRRNLSEIKAFVPSAQQQAAIDEQHTANDYSTCSASDSNFSELESSESEHDGDKVEHDALSHTSEPLVIDGSGAMRADSI